MTLVHCNPTAARTVDTQLQTLHSMACGVASAQQSQHGPMRSGGGKGLFWALVLGSGLPLQYKPWLGLRLLWWL